MIVVAACVTHELFKLSDASTIQTSIIPSFQLFHAGDGIHVLLGRHEHISRDDQVVFILQAQALYRSNLGVGRPSHKKQDHCSFLFGLS